MNKFQTNQCNPHHHSLTAKLAQRLMDQAPKDVYVYAVADYYNPGLDSVRVYNLSFGAAPEVSVKVVISADTTAEEAAEYEKKILEYFKL